MKNLLVTGGSRGIGAAIARLAAFNNYFVCVNYVNNDEKTRLLIEEIKIHGGKAISFKADISQEQEIVKLFQFIDKEMGSIDALVNNAAITGGKAQIKDVTSQQLEKVFLTNTIATILCTREAIRRMLIKNGCRYSAIVNLSSTAARTGCPNEWVHYAASKGAINSFTIGAAKEYGPHGIRINAVSPGFVDTEIHLDSGDPSRAQKSKDEIPLMRIGQPEEIAYAVLWLLSDQASYVNGAIVEVGGGR